MSDVVCCTQNVPRLLDRVLDLAGNKQSRQGYIFVAVFVAREPDSEFVVVDGGRVECLDWPGIVSRRQLKISGGAYSCKLSLTLSMS